MERNQVIEVRKLEGRFPDHNRVIPKAEDATQQIGFNADLLRRVLGFLMKIADPRSHYVRFSFYGPDHAIRIDAESVYEENGGATATAVIMPMRIDDKKQVKLEPAKIEEPVRLVLAQIADFMTTAAGLIADKPSRERVLDHARGVAWLVAEASEQDGQAPEQEHEDQGVEPVEEETSQ